MNAATQAASAKSGAGRVGRPPRVNAQAIIAAALEIGLEQATLKQIADRLGVGLATLYRHVSNRDELVRLAAFQLTLARRLPDAAHAHWSELATRYAESLYEAFLTEPQLITELLRGGIGPHAEVDVLEQFLAAVGKHGFAAEEGTHLFHAIGTLTIGAAAGAIGLAASQALREPWDKSLRRTLEERDAAELPLVRKSLPQYLKATPVQWLPSLRALLVGIAAARGEELTFTSAGASAATSAATIEEH
jgi:AcrR family transcriptional regulator